MLCRRYVPAVIAVLAASLGVPAAADQACPKTTSSDLFGAWRTGWVGTDALAVQLGADHVWGTTAPGAQIAVKLFWWSSAYRPGTESSLKVSVRRLDGAAVTARVTPTTNAYLGELDQVRESELYRTDASPDRWRMLVGIDFPDPGCWEITGEYLGQKLTFIAETR